ncbi:hypothetical protein [Mucilaginibacter paludis]|uniref:Uncharacterized protein n=1 Tax=Mucilaginibacter paludis DSM 18603 TaxID=714943 RepID=H1Y1V6_9SPHI|nr:hypothetical protein [Mucilaginibacter paludis]EHQ25659.1 hypothetical protein Mucpa_1501 [Mucilaginibacter paludis DSM 18603]
MSISATVKLTAFIFTCFIMPIALKQAVANRSYKANYIAFADGDSIKQRLVWQHVRDLKATAGGPMTFEHIGEKTMTVIAGRNGVLRSHYSKKNLTKKESAKISSSVLDGKFKLMGVYLDDNSKGSPPIYNIYYSDGSNILVKMDLYSIGFTCCAVFYSPNKINPFEHSNYIFHYDSKQELN